MIDDRLFKRRRRRCRFGLRRALRTQRFCMRRHGRLPIRCRLRLNGWLRRHDRPRRRDGALLLLCRRLRRFVFHSRFRRRRIHSHFGFLRRCKRRRSRLCFKLFFSILASRSDHLHQNQQRARREDQHDIARHAVGKRSGGGDIRQRGALLALDKDQIALPLAVFRLRTLQLKSEDRSILLIDHKF